MGAGFAIPSNLVRNIAQQLIDNGAVVRGYPGVVIRQLTRDLAESFGTEQSQGIRVAQVIEDSPADKAGLKSGNVVLEVNRRPIDSAAAFNRAVVESRQDRRVLLLIASADAQRYVVLSW